MSEYYKIIEKIECISKRRYCVHDAPYCFSGFFRNWDRRRTSTPCAFHLPRKWRADTNQLKEIREHLRAGNEDSAKRLIQTLNPSSVVDVGKVGG